MCCTTLLIYNNLSIVKLKNQHLPVHQVLAHFYRTTREESSDKQKHNFSYNDPIVKCSRSQVTDIKKFKKHKQISPFFEESVEKNKRRWLTFMKHSIARQETAVIG